MILCFLIYRTSLFGLLKDDILKPQFYLFAFLIKCLGIAAFYFIYYLFYGSLDYADTRHFMHDSQIIQSISKWNFGEFIKVIFGFQNEEPGTELYEKYIVHTALWNKNPLEFFYNDNRIVIRLHALIHFISFNSYFVHSLFSALLSLIGINWIYKSFKFLFVNKEVLLFSAWLLFPGTFFWTSGVLKEAPALFLIGLLLISLKRILIDRRINLKNTFMLAFGLVMSFLFKQYVMLPLLFLSGLFFILISFKIKRVALGYFVLILFFFVSANDGLRWVKGRSLLTVMADRQKVFLDMSKGGIYLLDSVKFVRVPYNYDLIRIDSTVNPSRVTIKKGVAFVYWEHTHQQDTLYNNYNRDTVSTFKFEYQLSPANATVNVPVMKGGYISLFKAMPAAFYVTLAKPLFIDARNKFDYLASLENVIILLSLIVLIFKWRKSKGDRNWSFYFLFLAFSVLLIIGITSPNVGAIERYRCLVVPFIIMVLLMSLGVNEKSGLFKLFRYRSSE